MKTQSLPLQNHAGGVTLAAYLADPPKGGGTGLTETRFRDRTHAGQRLGEALDAYANRPDVLVLALPRGGVPVAAEVAKKLNAPLDILVVRRRPLGQPLPHGLLLIVEQP